MVCLRLPTPSTNQTKEMEAMGDSLLELFCNIDDSCQQFVPAWNHRQLSIGERQCQRAQLSAANTK